MPSSFVEIVSDSAEQLGENLQKRSYLFALGLAAVATGVLAFMNVAVGGILGDHPANLLYPGALLIGFVGAVIARLEPRGMSRALFATAIALLLIPTGAHLVNAPAFNNGFPAVQALHTGFALAFGVSGVMFRSSSRSEETTDIGSNERLTD